MTEDGDRCTNPTHPDYKKFCHLNRWTDVTPSDIKMFLAHILIMGLVHKSSGEILEYEQLHKNPVLWQIYVKE